MKFYKRLNDEIKKINKNKEFNFNKEMSSVFERRKFIDNICQFRNKN